MTTQHIGTLCVVFFLNITTRGVGEMTIKAGKVRMGRVLKTMGVLNDHIEAMSVGRLLVQGKFDKVNPGTIDRCIEQGLVYESWDPATKIAEPKLTGFGRLVANGATSAR